MIILVYGNDMTELSAVAQDLRDKGHDAFERAANQFKASCVESCDQVILLCLCGAVERAYGEKVTHAYAIPEQEPKQAPEPAPAPTVKRSRGKKNARA